MGTILFLIDPGILPIGQLYTAFTAGQPCRKAPPGGCSFPAQPDSVILTYTMFPAEPISFLTNLIKIASAGASMNVFLSDKELKKIIKNIH